MFTMKKRMAHLKRINKEKEQLEKFNNAIAFANRVIDQSNDSDICTKEQIKTHPLIDVIRILGRGLQTEYLSQLLYSPYKIDIQDIQFWDVFFDNRFPLNSNKQTYGAIIQQLDIERDLDLSKDLVLPSPWSDDKYIKNISNIGEGRTKGKWIQSSTNHKVNLLLPMGIGWVNQGNHSIATGIIQGEGIITTTKVYDISPLYRYVECDGLYYRRIPDGEIINKVENVEFAAIFEIGRLMVQHSISF